MQLEKIISRIKKSFLNITLAISLAFGASAEASDYSVSQVTNGSKIEHRLYYKQHHFMTIIDDSGTFNIRPHPGLDRNGWGSSWYMQPFLPDANLKHTTIGNIVPNDNDIAVAASGYVSRGTNDTYGTWNTNLSFSYDPENKTVNGIGNYVINLSGDLSPSTGDLNLYKIASNYLHNVSLLTGGFGDTGDMQQADVMGKFNFTWNPPEHPSYFPQDIADYLSIDVIGQLNNVDTAAQGYQPIKPAYKPSMKIALNNSDPNHHGIDMIFGAIYDTSQSQYYWADNVGITPLILNRSSFIHYSFDVTFNSRALPGDTLDFKAFYGVCYGPFREGQSPGGIYPTKGQIKNDILILREATSAIRTYGIEGVLFEIPEICHEYGLDCYVGCEISGDYEDDQNTIADLIKIAKQGYSTTKALIVGNEYIYRNLSDPCSVSYLTGLINQVKQATDIPVTTGEPWDIWFVYPELINAVDFIAIHHYAFWRGFDISVAAQQDIGVYNAVKNEYPDKEVVILETGWPSDGGVVDQAVPSEANQKKFLENFVPLAQQNNIKYFIFEAFDEPWKKKHSEVEGHWGLYYNDRTLKPQLENIIYFPGFLLIQKCTVTAGSKDNSDKISFSGKMNATVDDFNDANVIVVTIDSEDMNSPCILTFPINNKTWKVKKGKYSYSGTENGVKKSFKYDLKTREFSFAASNVDLCGLACPLTVQIEINSYVGAVEVDEDVINGPKKPIPIKLMMGVKNALRVDSDKVKRGKKKPNTDQLTVKGGFAVEDPNVNLVDEEFVVTLGEQTFTLPAGSFKANKKKDKFTCSKVKLSDDSVATADFNFKTCSFTMTIKNTEIKADAGTIYLGLEFADFDESVPVVLP